MSGGHDSGSEYSEEQVASHVIVRCKSQQIILQGYGNAKEGQVVEVRYASVTQALFPHPEKHPALENRCRTLNFLETCRGSPVSPSCPIGLYHVLKKTLKLDLSQYISSDNSQWQP